MKCDECPLRDDQSVGCDGGACEFLRMQEEEKDTMHSSIVIGSGDIVKNLCPNSDHYGEFGNVLECVGKLVKVEFSNEEGGTDVEYINKKYLHI